MKGILLQVEFHSGNGGNFYSIIELHLGNEGNFISQLMFNQEMEGILTIEI